ncbi:MAG: hypothetical protein J6T69_06495 [Methanobrevibacter sp.]|nr:hypothetical protein [Methanobrevibacter sp.]
MILALVAHVPANSLSTDSFIEAISSSIFSICSSTSVHLSDNHVISGDSIFSSYSLKN